MSASAHKLGGPKGVGFLYIKKGTKIAPICYGGGQQKGMRSGTENVPGIVGLGKAIELATENISEHTKRLLFLRDNLITNIEKEIKDVKLNGHRTQRLCSNVNFSIKGIESESLIIMLDMNGICASSGSACNSGILSPSHVLTAIGVEDNIAKSTVRFSLGDDNTINDVNKITSVLKNIVQKLRK